MGVYQIGEVIKRIREGLGITQEELSDGICAVETLSRIECGKRTPSRANVKALMERLGRSGEMYLPTLHSLDMNMHTLSIQVSKLIASHRYEEAEQFLGELEKEVSMEDNVNLQFIIWGHTIIDVQLERISVPEALSGLEKALKYTIPSYRNSYLPHTIFTHQEVTVLCGMAILMKMDERAEEAIGLLEQLVKYFDTIQVSTDERSGAGALVLFNLGKMLGQIGESRKSLQIDERVRGICLSSGKAGSLSSVLYNIGYEKEVLDEDREECIELMREAYYVAELMKDERQRLHIKKHAVERYGDIF